MSDERKKQEKILSHHGVGKEGHPVEQAISALMVERIEHLRERLMHENDPAEVARLQGAAVELRRWAGLHGEMRTRRENGWDHDASG